MAVLVVFSSTLRELPLFGFSAEGAEFVSMSRAFLFYFVQFNLANGLPSDTIDTM